MTDQESIDSHKARYPEQYSHPLVGKVVRVSATKALLGKVERVMPSRYGPLVAIEGKDGEAWSLTHLEEVTGG